ncbi:MAG: helix-turn-helix domain-containing protein [Actinomycetota bacterium]|jgi:excisionase family DNA binding protein|nr:helix-turn-helix domain-containing protein [Chloroflexota bacterium]MDQ3989893.1 helix-turn-helix domain-containing protein [Actinomycetota bacterium]
MQDDAPKLLSTSETARLLGLSARTLARYVQQGVIEPDLISAGGHYRFDPEHVREQLRALRQRDE